MKERFSTEEWDDLLVLPFHLFAAIALADGEIQKEEIKEFLNRITRGALAYRDPLHKEVARGILDGDTGKFLTSATGAGGWDAQRTKTMMKDRLTSAEYQGFLGSMFIDLVNIAAASKTRKWFRKKGLGKEEQQRLTAIGIFWDLDLATLEGFKA